MAKKKLMQAPSYLECLNECADYNRLCGYFAAIVGGIISSRDDPIFNAKDSSDADTRYLGYVRTALKAFERRRDEVHAMQEKDRIEKQRQHDEFLIMLRRFFGCIAAVDGEYRSWGHKFGEAAKCMKDVHEICESLALMRERIGKGGIADVIDRER